MASPLNRTSAAQILRLCALCFKHGVLDAYELGDDYTAKEFLDKHRENWTYGILGDDDDYDWKMWRFYLYKWCRKSKLVRFGDRYLYEIKRFNYLYCPMIFAMRFYLLGISEWLEYPNPVGIERFRHDTRAHWTPSETSKFTRTGIIAEMQSIAYEYSRRPEEDREVSGGVIVDFASAMFDMTSTFVYKKRIIIDGEEIENTKADAS